MRLRRTVAFSLALSLLIVLFLPMSAKAEETTFAPFYVNTYSVRCNLSFSGELAECAAVAQGHSGTTKVSGTMTLQRKNSNGTYTDIKSWSASENSYVMFIDKSWFVERGYYYRLYFVADVTRNGTTETVSCRSGDVKCE